MTAKGERRCRCACCWGEPPEQRAQHAGRPTEAPTRAPTRAQAGRGVTIRKRLVRAYTLRDYDSTNRGTCDRWVKLRSPARPGHRQSAGRGLARSKVEALALLPGLPFHGCFGGRGNAAGRGWRRGVASRLQATPQDYSVFRVPPRTPCCTPHLAAHPAHPKTKNRVVASRVASHNHTHRIARRLWL